MLDVPTTTTTEVRSARMERTPEPYCRTLIVYESVAPQTLHKHRFIELILSLDGRPITIDIGHRRVAAPGHAIGPLIQHAIVACGPAARLYVAIGMRRVAPLQSVSDIPKAGIADLRDALLALGSNPAPEASERITLAWQRSWLPSFDSAARIDPRIERCLRHVNAKADPRATRDQLSALAGLSPSYFSALFLHDMGMPLGRYIIWRRVLIALEYLKDGSTTTQAAVFAGFADAPHLCRCYRATFGSSPSLLPVGRLSQHGDGLKFLAQL